MLKEIRKGNKLIYLDSINIEISDLSIYEYEDLVYIDSFSCDLYYFKDVINNLKNKYNDKPIIFKAPDINYVNKDSEQYNINLNYLYLLKNNGFNESNYFLLIENKEIKLLSNNSIFPTSLELYLKKIYKNNVLLKASNSLSNIVSNKHLTGEDIDMLHENNESYIKEKSLCDTHWDGA